MYDYGAVAMAGDKIITKRHSISAADEIYTRTPADGQVAQLSHENDHIFKQLKLGKEMCIRDSSLPCWKHGKKRKAKRMAANQVVAD